jgi:hypothetical protein
VAGKQARRDTRLHAAAKALHQRVRAAAVTGAQIQDAAL